MADLFQNESTRPSAHEEAADSVARPLADRLRPQSLSEIVGQDHLVGADGTITKMLARNHLGSLILFAY